MGEISLLNMLMAENLNDRNFTCITGIADIVPTMQSGKKRMFTVTTNGIPKCKPQGHISKCGQCGEKFNKYELMKAYENLIPSRWSG